MLRTREEAKEKKKSVATVRRVAGFALCRVPSHLMSTIGVLGALSFHCGVFLCACIVLFGFCFVFSPSDWKSRLEASWWADPSSDVKALQKKKEKRSIYAVVSSAQPLQCTEPGAELVSLKAGREV